MAKGTVESTLTKQGYKQIEYTPEQLMEFKKCCDYETGPLYFMKNFMKIQHPTRGGIPFDPFDYQLDLIENYNNHRYSINMLGRQMGKTTVAAGYLLWYAMFRPDSTILIAAHKASGSSEIMQRIRYAYENCPDHIRAGVTEYNKGSITFDNGSRLVSSTTTETTGRGMSLTLVYLDEFAFVPPRIAKEFWTSLSPTLSTGGKCIVTSTPNNDDDTFATIWKQAINTFDEFGNPTEVGANGFKGYLAKWDMHPDRDQAWADAERLRIGEERFLREHECEFIIYSETLIDALKLSTMTGKEPAFKSGQVRWYKYPDPQQTYIVSLDPSTGTGGDNSAIQVIEVPSLIQTAEWQHNKTPPEGQVKTLLEILEFLVSYGCSDIHWTVENNAVGESALLAIRDTGEENFPGVMMHEPKKTAASRRRKGFSTGARNKIDGCMSMKRLIENQKLTIHSEPFIRELKNFVATANSFKALPGEHDDLVMAMVIAVRMIMNLSTYEDSVYEVVNSNVGKGGGPDDEYDEPMPISFL